MKVFNIVMLLIIIPGCVSNNNRYANNSTPISSNIPTNVTEEEIYDLRHDGCMVGVADYAKINYDKDLTFNYLMKVCEVTIDKLK